MNDQNQMPPEHAVNLCALMAQMYPIQYGEAVREYRISLLEAKVAAMQPSANGPAPQEPKPPADHVVPETVVTPLKGTQ